jgi:hypothetical protein
MGYNNGGDGGQMMIVLMMMMIMVCSVSCCSSSLMTAYANECDDSGSFDFLKFDGYFDSMPEGGILGCQSSSGDTSGGGDASGGGSGSGCSVGDTSLYRYDDRKLTNGTWSCASGWEDTGCNWGDGENEKRQCRQSISGTTSASTSKCNLGTESNYDYRERRLTSSGKWRCPDGYQDTRCGLVTGSDGKWVDGDEKGKKQCRKRKKGTSSSSNCIIVFSDGKGTNRSSGERTFCLESGKDDFKMQDLRTVDWHDRISSVTVPKGLTLSLWDNAGWKGKQTEDIVGPVTNKDLGEVQYKNGQGGSIRNEASTLHFWKSSSGGQSPTTTTIRSSGTGPSTSWKSGKKVELYRDINYSGKVKGYDSASVPDASKEGMNKVISSMGITPGYVFKGCDKKNFKGKCKEWTKNTKWIGTTWNDKIQSYKIYKK